MKQIFTILLPILLLTATSFASKIQQQGIKTAAECVTAGATAATCLPLDSQIYVNANGVQDTLFNAITNGQIGGGGAKNYIVNYGAESSVGGWALFKDAAASTPADGTTDKTVSSISSNTFNATAHGFNNGDIVHIAFTSGGAMPTGVTFGTDYYVVNKATNTFQLSLTSGGTAITASAGTNLVVYGLTANTGTTVTWARTTSSAIRGAGSFLLTKDAASRQGEGASYDFTIDNADTLKVLQGYIEYNVNSGTFADGDAAIYIYDLVAGTIQPAPYKILNTGTNPQKLQFEFQASTSNYYRVLMYVATTSAVAYSLKIDSVNVGPQAKLYGSPVTDWISFTPTGSWSTNTTYTGYWRRVGDSLQVVYKLALAGAPTNASLTVNLPSGLTIDNAKQATSNDPATGRVKMISAGNVVDGILLASSNTAFLVRYINSNTGSNPQPALTANLSATLPFTFANGDSVSIEATVPISGWSSSTIMSADASSNIVSLSVTKSGTQAVTANTTNISFTTTSKDTNGGWNGTDTYTVQVPGDYWVSFGAMIDNGGGTDTFIIYKNGSSAASGFPASTSGTQSTAGTAKIDGLVAGDTITLRCGQTTTLAASGRFQLARISGPAQIAASESVNARYSNTAGTSIANSGDVVVPFATKSYDSHSAFVTDTYTAPMSGKYKAYCQTWFSSSTYASGNHIYTELQKNGSVVTYGQATYLYAAATAALSSFVGDTLNLVQGDTIKCSVNNNRTAGATTLDTVAGENYFTVERVGN